MSKKDICNIFHEKAGCYCMRAKGHDGICWSLAIGRNGGSFTRCEWWSENGKFKQHVRYDTHYPTNAQRGSTR